MALTSEEQALRQALNDIAIGQPDVPVDRISGVRRRHTRRRTLQVAGAAVAAVAVIAGALVARIDVFNGSQVTPAHRSVPSWALPWPDHRDGSVPQKVLDGAVKFWRVDSAHPTMPTQLQHIVWYAGGLVADGKTVVAVFEIDSGFGRRLVAGWATASEVMHGQRPVTGNGSAWVLYDVPAPPADYRGFVGLNVPGADNSSGFPPNWVVLLSRPDTTRVFVSGQRWTPMKNGYAVIDTGQLTFGPLEVSAQLTNGEYIGGIVGVPGAPKSKVPQLAAVAPLTYPGRIYAGLGGQGDSMYEDDSNHGQASQLYVRCRGQGQVRIRLSDSAPTPPRGGYVVNRPCDDAQYAITIPPSARTHRYLSVHASPYSAWDVAMVVPAKK
jgi:hypothetical protein